MTLLANWFAECFKHQDNLFNHTLGCGFFVPFFNFNFLKELCEKVGVENGTFPLSLDLFSPENPDFLIYKRQFPSCVCIELGTMFNISFP